MSLLPIAQWLPKYQRPWLTGDMLAGISLAGLLIPEAMGYAGIAGLPPQAGLYATAIGLFIYALFGSSRHLVVSPTSSSAALLAAAIGPLVIGHPTHYAAMAAATVLITGLLFLIAGFFRLGFISEFISKPVLRGFVFGIAITIMIKQLPKLMGIDATHGNAFEQLWHVVTAITTTHLWSFGIGATALALLFLLRTTLPRIPAALVALVLGITVSRLVGLEAHGVAIVGHVPQGLPTPGFSLFRWEVWTSIMPAAAGLVLVIYAEALGAARTFAAKNNYEIDANQELKALGMANIAASFFPSIVVGGGTSGSAANEGAGAQSEVSAIVASCIVIITLLFLTPLFHDLPDPVLAAIVFYAVWHLANIAELKRYAQLQTGELGIAMVALIGVPAFGILSGLLLAMALTLIAMMRNMSDPHVVELGRLPATRDFVAQDRHINVETIPGLLILRFDRLLFFANANRVHSELKEMLQKAAETASSILISFEVVPELDVTSLDMLRQFKSEADSQHIHLALARVKDPVIDIFKRSGFLQELGEENIFWSVDDAVQAYLSQPECEFS